MEPLYRYIETVMPGMPDRFRRERRRVLIVSGIVMVIGFLGYCINGLRPASAASEPKKFIVEPGEGIVDITDRLEDAGLIRNANAFRIVAILTFEAHRLQAGGYMFRSDQNGYSILQALVAGSVHELDVRIPEGASFYQIDSILSDAGVLKKGAFVAYVEQSADPLEGRLFPDSYRFFPGSSAKEVADKMRETFNLKALPLLAADQTNLERNMILASILEKEVPHPADREIVAGILLKRIKEGMPLQVDSSLCYMKQKTKNAFGDCLPITALDLKFNSPYNTYLHSGWPPGPIGNPGLEAIQAALRPQNSPYWFYLSDPATQNTIFSRTLDEHARNRAKYL